MTAASSLLDGIHQEDEFGANLVVTPVLTGGVASGESIGSNIVQGFTDPLLNTWALSIVSATQILSIETPTEDI